MSTHQNDQRTPGHGESAPSPSPSRDELADLDASPSDDEVRGGASDYLLMIDGVKARPPLGLDKASPKL
jgi:hypothetical protein